MEAIDYKKLADELTSQLTPMLATKDTLWNSADCARYLRLSRRVFAEQTCKSPEFPQPFKLKSGSNNRWKAQEVIKWAS